MWIWINIHTYIQVLNIYIVELLSSSDLYGYLDHFSPLLLTLATQRGFFFSQIACQSSPHFLCISFKIHKFKENFAWRTACRNTVACAGGPGAIEQEIMDYVAALKSMVPPTQPLSYGKLALFSALVYGCYSRWGFSNWKVLPNWVILCYAWIAGDWYPCRSCNLLVITIRKSETVQGIKLLVEVYVWLWNTFSLYIILITGGLKMVKPAIKTNYISYVCSS